MSFPKRTDDWSYDFRHVLNGELDLFDSAVAKARDESAENRPKESPGPTPPTVHPVSPSLAEADAPEPDAIARAHAKQLVGLAFSGGGIRSATFNLGVLQSLARMKLLSRFNYLSTVSGGGYIGCWLMAWIKRHKMKDVARNLTPEWVDQPGRKEPAEIRFLRRFSNYLTPKLGWLGADTWTVVAVYLRNLILNFIVLAAACGFFLLLPTMIAFASKDWVGHVSFQILEVVALAALAWSAFSIINALRYFARRDGEIKRVVVPLPGLAEWFPRVDGVAWYPSKLFDGDFILRLKFTVKASGERDIYIWAPIKGRRKPRVLAGAAVKILLPSDETTTASQKFRTGSINLQSAVRRAEVIPNENELMVVCAEDQCTVSVNGLTLNSARVIRPKPGGLLQFIPFFRTFLAIGVDDDESAIAFSSITVEKVETPSDTGSTQGQVQRRIIAPLFLAAFVGTFLFRFGVLPLNQQSVIDLPDRPLGFGPAGTPWDWRWSAAIAGGGTAALVFALRIVHKFPASIAWFFGTFASWMKSLVRHKKLQRMPSRGGWPMSGDNSSWMQIGAETITFAFAASIGGLTVPALYQLFEKKDVWCVTTWGTPALMGVFLLMIVFHIGFMGRAMQDERREWWGRLSAWLLIYSLGWIAIFGLAFYGPRLFIWVTDQSTIWVGAISASWSLSTLGGLVAARSAATGPDKSNKLVETIAKVAPYIFVVGFFFVLSSAVNALVPYMDRPVQGFQWWTRLKELGAQINMTSDWWNPLLATLITGLITVAFSLRLDINQFSMHLLYRNRLGRCYLGASNRLRRAQPFTGFSASDDCLLSELKSVPYGDPIHSAPYPIICAALNLVGGKELAWQQRKAASFTFSPHFCGYDFSELPPGYCRTEMFAQRPPPPITLATAMAISGAAASPNMGYHTSAAPAFLMTVFNVRLGWWLGNPRHQKGYERSGPLNVIWRLACELFGLTSEEGKYIYLSDGGHFENLGIYELVRRRCRFIVACDVEEDHTFGFGGLGNAIEKCRSDFGIDIDIDVEPIRRRSEKGHSQSHCAVGRIFYSRVDPDGRDGILVYLKSSLTGDEPTDVLRYAAANPEFPHQTTGDQWFDESQFESYRVLGYHIARNVFLPLGDAETVSTLPNEEIFVRLSQHWYPPSAATAESFTKHTDAIIAIYDELRTNKNLQFLNRDIYPEWRILFAQKTSPESPSLAFDHPKSLRTLLPKSPAALRAGFYVCTSMCDLFEAVYVDLRLEQEFDHPDNRGWMNFFRHWASTPMFRVTWAIGASNYGSRFQSFCARHLHLGPGTTSLKSLELRSKRWDEFPDTIPWSPATGRIAEEIVDAIWTWLAGLPVGSEVIARAALTVTSKAPDYLPQRKDRENEVRRKGRFLVRQALKRAKLAGKFPKRIPTEKDEEWYAAETLLEFLRRKVRKQVFKDEWPKKVAELALLHAATIASHVLDDVFQTELNPLERELIELFFIFHPRLASSAQIIRVEITPESRLSDRKRDMYFPVGFAILARTEWPPSPKDRHKLISLRVQNHLRSMGVARNALRQLIDDHPGLEIELKGMHPNSPEVPTDKDYSQLLRLFHSAKTDAAQTKT